MPDPRTLELTRRFQQRIFTIGERAALVTVGAWLALPLHNEDNIPEFADKVGPTITAAKVAAVATAAAFYSLLAGKRPVGIDAAAVEVAADPRDPFISFWLALKNDHPIGDALESGRTRARAFAHDVPIDAGRGTADLVMHRQGLRPGGWTRIPEPGACAWCQTVAAQTYSSRDAASFRHGGTNHPPCHCTVVPNIA